MKYEIRFTGQFKKDLKLAKKQGKNLDKLFDVREPFRTVQVKTEPASFSQAFLHIQVVADECGAAEEHGWGVLEDYFAPFAKNPRSFSTKSG